MYFKVNHVIPAAMIKGTTTSIQDIEFPHERGKADVGTENPESDAYRATPLVMRSSSIQPAKSLASLSVAPSLKVLELVPIVIDSVNEPNITPST